MEKKVETDVATPDAATPPTADSPAEPPSKPEAAGEPAASDGQVETAEAVPAAEPDEVKPATEQTTRFPRRPREDDGAEPPAAEADQAPEDQLEIDTDDTAVGDAPVRQLTAKAPPEAVGGAMAGVKSTQRLSIPGYQLRAQIEALLFVSQTPLSPRALARQLSVEVREVRDALADLKDDCGDRGIEPVEVAGGWQLRTKPEHAPLLRRFLQAKPARLSRAALETLAIVAYKQPITRAEVEDIRGVDSGAVLRGLLERRLVRILGRKEEPGRPIIYGTAPAFLELFGLKTLRELPTLREFVELSEEHQRKVEREAPIENDTAQLEMEAYLEDLEAAGIDVDSPPDEAAADADAVDVHVSEGDLPLEGVDEAVDGDRAAEAGDEPVEIDDADEPDEIDDADEPDEIDDDSPDKIA